MALHDDDDYSDSVVESGDYGGDPATTTTTTTMTMIMMVMMTKRGKFSRTA